MKRPTIIALVLVGVGGVAFTQIVELYTNSTGSMLPCYAVKERLIVNELAFGYRLPLIDRQILSWGTPTRGDVIIFRYPRDPSKSYVKRIVALPGDRVRVDGIDLIINDERVKRTGPEPYSYESSPLFDDPFVQASTKQAQHFLETPHGGTADRAYGVIYEDTGFSRGSFPRGDVLPGLECEPGESGGCTVSDDYLFVMGDNRDNTSDSRVWGGVPFSHLVGRLIF